MTPRTTVLAGLFAAISCFCLGLWAGRQNPTETVVYKDRVQYVDRVVKETSQTKKDTVTVREQTVKKPDGTTVDTKTYKVDQQEAREDRQEREVEKTETREIKKTETLPNWRVSVGVKPTDTKDFMLSAGRRLLGPFWGEASVRPKTREMTLGLGVEF